MNLEKSVIDIIKELGILNISKELPFIKPTIKTREREEVRPIFWAIRPKSYIARTSQWDEFPNGRWGVSRSPAFGAPEEYYIVNKKISFFPEERRKLWGEEINSISSLANVFINYLTGKIKKFPFAEGSL